MGEDIEGMPIGVLYVRYLMSSFLYYEDYPVLPYSDTQFDMVCRRLLREWDTFEHMHKHLCDEEMLKAGTGYSIEFPLITQHAAQDWVGEYTKGTTT